MSPPPPVERGRYTDGLSGDQNDAKKTDRMGARFEDVTGHSGFLQLY